MSTAVAELQSTDLDALHEDLHQFVTFTVNNQLFGVHVLRVQDILQTEKIAPIPLAPPEVRGSINLRGRIVTVIDVRVRLGLEPLDHEENKQMGVTVEMGPDLYTLLVDSIGDVISLPGDLYEKTPGTLNPAWRDFASGVYRLDGRIMVVLEIDRLLDIGNED
jgi:purine-binding chemotaxis protein CheW